MPHTILFVEYIKSITHIQAISRCRIGLEFHQDFPEPTAAMGKEDLRAVVARMLASAADRLAMAHLAASSADRLPMARRAVAPRVR